ncbi:MAG: LPS export ABC transporter periplasmic protein LptC [Bacteroidota bacterium]
MNYFKTSVSIFSLFTFYFSLFFFSCQTDIQTINLITSQKNLPSESMKESEIIYSDSGKVKMKLTAPLLDRYQKENPYIEMPEGVHLFFYDDSMNINSELKANYGIRYEKEGTMEAKRNVEVVNVKGEKLNTEHLIWNEVKHIIYTEAFVKITTANEVIYGDGLESNQDFTKYKIKNIKGTFNLKEKESQ